MTILATHTRILLMRCFEDTFDEFGDRTHDPVWACEIKTSLADAILSGRLMSGLGLEFTKDADPTTALELGLIPDTSTPRTSLQQVIDCAPCGRRANGSCEASLQSAVTCRMSCFRLDEHRIRLGLRIAVTAVRWLPKTLQCGSHCALFEIQAHRVTKEQSWHPSSQEPCQLPTTNSTPVKAPFQGAKHSTHQPAVGIATLRQSCRFLQIKGL